MSYINLKGLVGVAEISEGTMVPFTIILWDPSYVEVSVVTTGDGKESRPPDC